MQPDVEEGQNAKGRHHMISTLTLDSSCGLQNHDQRVDHARNKKEDGQHQVKPEGAAEAGFKRYGDRRQEDREDDKEKFVR